MRWELTTKQQLQTILKEKDCPPPLWKRAVLEMLDRNLFDPLIKKVANHVMNVGVVSQIHGMTIEDFLQIGRLEIYKIKDKFKLDKGEFISFAFMAIKQEFIRQIEKVEAAKRYNRNLISYQQETEEGNELEVFLRDKKIDVEKFVINKITIEQLLNRVNEHQRTILSYYMQGYTFMEIADMMGKGTFQSIHQQYTKALKDMRRGA